MDNSIRSSGKPDHPDQTGADKVLVEPGGGLPLLPNDRTVVDPGYAGMQTGRVPVSASDDKTVLDPEYARSQIQRATPVVQAASAGEEKTRVVTTASAFALQAATGGETAASPSGFTETDRTGSAGPQESAMALPAGFKLFEYRIDKVLGQGGFGITYLATDVHLDSKVAVKEYLPGDFAYRASDKSVSPRRSEDRDFYFFGLDSFLIEARTLATFRHPNIVRVARFFEANATAYMVLEYERGNPLKSWWRNHADIAEADLVQLLSPLLDGLSVVHATGFLHRDIKPDNIYVRQEDGSLVLLDFGAAIQAAGDVCAGGVVTPGYAPIEQYEDGRQGPWTDIYALGATLYWMVTGSKPPPSPTRLAETDTLVSAEEAGRGRFSPEFLRTIDWSLKIRAEDRPQNMQEFRQALLGAHASSLGLQEALRSDERDVTGSEGWGVALSSPLLLKGKLARASRTLLRPASWPIALKMTLAMILTALLPMLITAYYNLNGSLASVSSSELRNLEQLAQSTAGRISQLIGDSQNLARYLGTDEDFVGFLAQPTEGGKKALLAKLDGLVKANPDVHLLMVMDTDGTAVVSSDPAVMGRNFKFREYFRVAMEGRPHVTGIVVGAVAGAAGVFYANPVMGENGKPIGAVVLRIKASSINAILDEVRQVSQQRIPMLIDGDGILIYHPNTNLLYRSLTTVPKDTLDKIVSDQRFRRESIESLNMPDLAGKLVHAKIPGNISYQSSVSGTSEIAGFAPVKGHTWVVAVTETRAFFAEPLNQLFNNVLYSVILVGLIFLLLALLFARSIVNPIEALTGAAHALKSGDFDKATLRVTSDDEIGRLARTFNVMIDVLRQRERERERLAKRAVTSAREK
jgi:serine/threonine protein kinase/HAMP domain-containing protein